MAAAALAELHLPWYVFGAQAAVVWGRPRLTTDVVVTLRLGGLDPRSVLHHQDDDARERAETSWAATPSANAPGIASSAVAKLVSCCPMSPTVLRVEVTDDELRVDLADGRRIIVPLLVPEAISRGLALFRGAGLRVDLA